MKRLLVIFALLGVVGTAAAFRGGALPGPAGRITPYVQNWSAFGWFTSTNTPNVPVASFKTGAASTVRSITFIVPNPAINGTGTGTYDLTDSTGAVLSPPCTINIPCTAIATMGTTSTATCSAALMGSTTYQLRLKAQCVGSASGFAVVDFEVTTP